MIPHDSGPEIENQLCKKKKSHREVRIITLEAAWERVRIYPILDVVYINSNPHTLSRFCVLITHLGRIIAALECTERGIDSIEPVIERCT